MTEHWSRVLPLREEVTSSDGGVGELQMSLHKAVFHQLYQYKVKHGIPTWEEVIERIIPVPVEETVI